MSFQKGAAVVAAVMEIRANNAIKPGELVLFTRDIVRWLYRHVSKNGGAARTREAPPDVRWKKSARTTTDQYFIVARLQHIRHGNVCEVDRNECTRMTVTTSEWDIIRNFLPIL